MPRPQDRPPGFVRETVRLMRQTMRRVRGNVRAFLGDRQFALWLIALGIGVGTGCAAVLFRLSIGAVQWLWTGTHSEMNLAAIAAQPWWVVLLAPVAGGLVVGLVNQHFLEGRRPGGVADVIQARIQEGRGLGFKNGLLTAIATAISLGSGASAGREGPVVHLGATIALAASRFFTMFQLDQVGRRILLGCGVAGAISASFNAPIAGVLFAHEVILGHYAMRAFVPIVIASMSGSIVNRVFIGETAAFEIPEYAIGSILELPAFVVLGVVAAVVAISFQFLLIFFDQAARSLVLPAWSRPVLGGVVLGLVGIAFPEVLGVGYEATDSALKQQYDALTMIALLVVKMVATALTLASRFGGGIFSPSLYLGAMAGGAFGLIATSIFPEVSSDHGLYAILGMGAVAAAMLGAPISTTMIVFELTGGYALSIALLLTVAIATSLHQAVHGRSFFQWQLDQRGVLEGHHYFMQTVRASTIMKPEPEPPPGEEPRGAEEGEAFLRPADPLQRILNLFNETGLDVLPVREGKGLRKVGTVTHVEALRALNSRLIAQSEEEHR